MTKDSNVTIEIPIATTLAYSVSELVVHQGGQFGEYSSTFFYFYLLERKKMTQRVYIGLLYIIKIFSNPNENVLLAVLCVTSDTDGGFEIDSVAGSESSERDLQKGEKLCSQTPLVFLEKNVTEKNPFLFI